MRKLIEIPASDIEAAGFQIEAPLPADWLTQQVSDADGRAATDGHVKARLSRTGRANIIVRGTVRAEIEVPCARCLREAPVSVHGELSLMLEPRPTSLADGPPRGTPPKDRDDKRVPKAGKAKGKVPRITEYEFSSEEAERDDYDGETVVLDAFIREAILLELPNFPLCSETCAGISPVPRPGGHLTKAWGRSAHSAKSRPTPVEPQAPHNPFEALKHLARELPPGPEPSADGPSPPFEAPPPAPGSHPHTPAPPARLVTSHAAPLRKTAAKKLTNRARAARKATKRKKH